MVVLIMIIKGCIFFEKKCLSRFMLIFEMCIIIKFNN